MAAGYSLKDDLFNAQTVRHLGGLFDAAGVFASDPFVDDVMARLAPLELKARIAMIAEVLADHLPNNFPQAALAMRKALPPPLDPLAQDDDFGHFIYAPLGVYVENHGLAHDFDLSLDLLHDITQRFSMEFSLRAFLNADATRTMTRATQWAQSDNYHVRRLASEGTRPRLPWGQGIGLQPADTLPVLDMLHADPTRYVTRSVANHLNDISKIDPDLAVAQLDKWRRDGRQNSKELDWIARHALRGLIKAGHAGAMAHLGYDPDVAVKIADFGLATVTPARGDKVAVSATLITPDDAPLIVDYIVDYVKANGRTAPKVFKLKVTQTKAGQALHLTKQHHFKDDATTFRLYPGAHRIHLQVNGRIRASQAFDLS
ncbi:DNA alkylation repair protein [Yoonia sp. 208BN28-4]|uniref:DNA alkylation repair protein n=1 Tax=Yoonia sp. 208BN28-4 TaxID=3126505 RepID=UPI00309FDE16